MTMYTFRLLVSFYFINNKRLSLYMSDITNDFIYGFYLSQLCLLQLSRLRQHMSDNEEMIRIFTKVPLLGRLMYSFA